MRVLCVGTSYHRIPYLYGMIETVGNQTYPCDFVLSIKDMDRKTFDKFILTPLWKYFSTGRIRTFFHKNSTCQFENYFASLREVDLTQYDLIVKIDDDDFYGTRYVENIVKFCKELGRIPDLCGRRYLTCSNGYWVYTEMVVAEAYCNSFGPTMAMSSEFMQRVLADKPVSKNVWFEDNYIHEKYKSSAFYADRPNTNDFVYNRHKSNIS